MVPTEHKMVDMSILLRAGATIQAVDKSGKPQEDTYWCTCHQVWAMGLAMWCSSMCDKVRDKVIYRAPYRAIRCSIRYLVAPPCCATRCAIRYLVAPTCCTTVTPNRSIFKMKVKASTAIQQCCSTLEGLGMQPLKKVSRKQQQKRFKMAEQFLRSLLQDREVQVRMTHQGVVHLRGGCASVKDGNNATVE